MCRGGQKRRKKEGKRGKKEKKIEQRDKTKKERKKYKDRERYEKMQLNCLLKTWSRLGDWYPKSKQLKLRE